AVERPEPEHVGQQGPLDANVADDGLEPNAAGQCGRVDRAVFDPCTNTPMQVAKGDSPFEEVNDVDRLLNGCVNENGSVQSGVVSPVCLNGRDPQLLCVRVHVS